MSGLSSRYENADALEACEPSEKESVPAADGRRAGAAARATGCKGSAAAVGIQACGRLRKVSGKCAGCIGLTGSQHGAAGGGAGHATEPFHLGFACGLLGSSCSIL